MIISQLLDETDIQVPKVRKVIKPSKNKRGKAYSDEKIEVC